MPIKAAAAFLIAATLAVPAFALDRTPAPSEGQIRTWMAGNLCRCTGYDKIVRAVLAAAEALAGGKEEVSA